MNYYLSRIARQVPEVSIPLLHDDHYLSIGWPNVGGDESFNKAMHQNLDDFESVYTSKTGHHGKSRYYLKRFLGMQPGDIVIVPRNGGLFDIVEIEGHWLGATEIPEELQKKHNIGHDEKGLGFFYKVKILNKEDLLRRDAIGALQRRMKFRGTTSWIGSVDGDKVSGQRDIIEGIHAFLQKEEGAKPSININSAFNDLTRTSIKEMLYKVLDARKFEQLVAWYMQKIGASDVQLGGEKHNYTGADDIDVIAEFDALNLSIIVQVKEYAPESKTSEWAVTQVDAYNDLYNKDQNNKDQNNKDQDDLNHVTLLWVVSLGTFNEKAVCDAQDKSVRLIDGDELVDSILQVGLSGLSDALA